jgi:hypothetical protein
MKFRNAYLIILVFAALSLSGCFLTDTVRLDDAKAKVAQLEEALATTDRQLTAITKQLDEAKRIAKETGSETAIRIAAQLENAAEVTRASLPHLRDAVDKAKATVADIEKNGETAPLWYVLAGFAVQYVPRLATLIPGIGPAAAPLAGAIANGLWQSLATRRQREEDEQAAAAAKKLAATNTPDTKG